MDPAESYRPRPNGVTCAMTAAGLCLAGMVRDRRPVEDPRLRLIALLVIYAGVIGSGIVGLLVVVVAGLSHQRAVVVSLAGLEVFASLGCALQTIRLLVLLRLSGGLFRPQWVSPIGRVRERLVEPSDFDLAAQALSAVVVLAAGGNL